MTNGQQFAPGLKNIDDATAMRRRILLAFEAAEREQNPEKLRAWMTFVIVGAGPTGAELAGALGEIAHDTLVHDFRDIDSTQHAASFSSKAPTARCPPIRRSFPKPRAKCSTRLGVTVRTGAMVTDVRADGVTIREGDRSENIPTRTVLWAAGVLASPLGRILDRRSRRARSTSFGRVIVEPDMSIAGASGNFRHRRPREFQPSNRQAASRRRAARDPAGRLRRETDSRAAARQETSAISLFR